MTEQERLQFTSSQGFHTTNAAFCTRVHLQGDRFKLGKKKKQQGRNERKGQVKRQTQVYKPACLVALS